MNQVQPIIESIATVVGTSSVDSPIPLHEPDLTGSGCLKYLQDCINSGWVSTGGSWGTRFETSISQLTGAKHVVAVSNGTVALRLALHLVGVRPTDEVLLPSLTFVATANAISHLHATPHFVDIESEYLGIDPNLLRDYLISNTFEHMAHFLISILEEELLQ